MEEPETIDYPIDGLLDLHTFNPREVKGLIVEYLEACRERGILHVRIVHGKGTGQLKRTVHAVLGRLPAVEWFRLAGHDAGGYGATEVGLLAKNR
jgi:DNA-nicking Smr family endonuclease